MAVGCGEDSVDDYDDKYDDDDDSGDSSTLVAMISLL